MTFEVGQSVKFVKVNDNSPTLLGQVGTIHSVENHPLYPYEVDILGVGIFPASADGLEAAS